MSDNGLMTAMKSVLPAKWTKPRPLVPVLRFSGPIGVNSPFKQELSLPTVAASIDKAFSMRGAKAIAIQINSPGGAAVQSTLIHNRIRALAAEKNLKVYAFCEDVAASGGYMLSLAGDEIYADPSSIVGSIGVIAAGFGFPGLLEKIGVERRVYTAGTSKDTLDPFLPEKLEDVKRIKEIQLDVHEAFIGMVKSRRGGKLTKPDDELFTGAFWSGKTALELGLIDGLSDLRTRMREVFGEDVRFKLVAPATSWLRRGKKSVSAGVSGLDLGQWPQGFAADVISAIEARALWSRFGL